jgi:hypothetical protein
MAVALMDQGEREADLDSVGTRKLALTAIHA